jgi:DDE superfamily endonuclease
MYLQDMAVTLMYVYNMTAHDVGRILGVSSRAIRRWCVMFHSHGHVMQSERRARTSSYPSDVLEYISKYVKIHPCFYVDELQAEIRSQYGERSLPTSHATILRALWFDLRLSRKVLDRRAREAMPMEVDNYARKLNCFYSYPEQMVFVDETSKDGTSARRRYAWSRRGTRAVVATSFSRGNRVSVLAACDTKGFIGWTSTRGTFTRRSFHDGFLRVVIPKLNPWPLPRSIVVIDNAKIHMYEELAAAVHQCGAILLYLPPYCPHLNPVEIMFGRLKSWLTRHAHLAFPLYPELVLNVAMPRCLRFDHHGVNLFRHCGYGCNGLIEDVFNAPLGFNG